MRLPGRQQGARRYAFSHPFPRELHETSESRATGLSAIEHNIQQKPLANAWLSDEHMLLMFLRHAKVRAVRLQAWVSLH